VRQGIKQYGSYAFTDAIYLRPVIASNNFSSALHILPTDPNNLAIRSPSSFVADPPKLITTKCKQIRDPSILMFFTKVDAKESTANKNYKI
jgi:hypothetical protein